MATLKAISLWQPWASLLVSGRKRIETRSWPLRCALPVRLAVHAAKRWTADEEDLAHTEPFRAALQALGALGPGAAADLDVRLPFGCLLGTVEVVACLRTADVAFVTDHYHHGRAVVTPTERAFGDYAPGRWAWLCRDAQPLPVPVPCKGQQGLWDVAARIFACRGYEGGAQGQPCCERAGEYNGYASGSLLFLCPKGCGCHD